MECIRCNNKITDKRLKRTCRACLDAKKELKQEREGTVKCNCCRLYKDTGAYCTIQQFNTCSECRTYKQGKNQERRDKETNTEYTQHREHREHNIGALIKYLQDKYNITESEETIQHILTA